ncbi:MAG: hypothetical protein WBW04_05435 [Nitrolancea sp.]
MTQPVRFEDIHLERIQRLYSFHQQGLIPTPEKHEVHPELPLGSRENYLYFTLSCCLNFRRSSVGLWRSALATYQDPECRYLFNPTDVMRRDTSQVCGHLFKYRLAIQVNRHPRIWMAICQTLAEHYDSDPRNVLAEADFDAGRVIHNLQTEKRHLFPYLGGRKLSNYWLFILSRFTDAPLTNVDQISIIPDTNVIKSTVHLGLADDGVSPQRVEEIWRTVTDQIGLAPIELHPVLWNWARNRFTPAV